MYTRADYMDKRCTHSEYYGEIVADAGIDFTNAPIMDRVREALASGDEHLNTIPLRTWDIMGAGLLWIAPHFKARKDTMSLAGLVCVAKEAARRAHVEDAQNA